MNNLALIFAEGGLGKDFIYVVIAILGGITIIGGIVGTIIMLIVNSISGNKKPPKYYWAVFAICAVSTLLISGMICSSA